VLLASLAEPADRLWRITPAMTSLKSWLSGGLGVVLVIAVAKLLLHLATASRYGYFGDELYFMACGEHLDWGYVDQPPLVGLVAWLVRHTLGTSLLAMRLPSALAGAALVLLTGLLAREMGGGRFAMGLSALASGLAFVYVVMHYVTHQALNANPASLPIWLAGLGWLLVSRRGRAFRPLGTAFLVTLAAAGGVSLEGFTAAGWRTRLRPALVLLFALSLPFLPFGLPLLPPQDLIAYQERLGMTLPATEKAHARAVLPHHFAWQFGWDEMVAAVAAAYHAMPPEEQARVAVIGNNYGDSGAIDLLGPKYGLPMKALGTHQSYWLWGPGDPSKDVFIVLGDRPEGLRRWCEEVEVAAELSHPWTAVWENKPVLVCRRPRVPLDEMWPKVKNWG